METIEETVVKEAVEQSEIDVFANRLEKLMQTGMTNREAGALAVRMLLRDRPGSGDDRRICLECKGLRGTVCTNAAAMGLRAGMEPVRTVLQRCDGFDLRGSK